MANLAIVILMLGLPSGAAVALILYLRRRWGADTQVDDTTPRGGEWDWGDFDFGSGD
ncbi:MAG: hypothetical protein ABIO35_05680 [Nitrobacter sp.]